MNTPMADLGINYSHWGVNSSHPRKKKAFSPLTVKGCDRDQL